MENQTESRFVLHQSFDLVEIVTSKPGLLEAAKRDAFCSNGINKIFKFVVFFQAINIVAVTVWGSKITGLRRACHLLERRTIRADDRVRKSRLVTAR
eukprot:13283513-Ditylum_brightwellii.AAC.1